VAVKLRLMRMGKKKQPTYRVVAADSRAPRNGRFIEVLGFYAPREEPSVVRIDHARVLSWLEQGAQPTEAVERLLRISGALEEHEARRPARREDRRERRRRERPARGAASRSAGGSSPKAASDARASADT
jgi:small subunit ribosomal protein S16